MSYAGPKRPAARSKPTARTGRPATGRPDRDWEQLALFGAGLALGIVVGAGATLLTAPHSGRETRAEIRAYAGRTRRGLSRRTSAAWLDLRDELRGAVSALKERKSKRRLAAAREVEIESAEAGDTYRTS